MPETDEQRLARTLCERPRPKVDCEGCEHLGEMLADSEARIAELEAALRELAGDEFWLVRLSSMHDVGAMQGVIRDFAKATLARNEAKR